MWVDTTLRNYLNQPGRNHVLVEMIDISAEMQAQETLEDREELLRRLTNAMPVGLLHLNTERDVVYHNARLLDILYGSHAATPEQTATIPEPAAEEPDTDTDTGTVGTLLQTLTSEGRTAFDVALDEVLNEGADRDVEADIALPAGGWRRALFSLRALLRASGEVSGAITCVLDVTDSARARAELEQRATYDTLTDCYNRSSIIDALERELAREDGGQTGAVYVDLDLFKPVNDTLGHAAGDELLALVGERLRYASRDSDMVGRLGGDEFLVILRDVPDTATAVRVADRISEVLCSTCELSCGNVELRASIGVACSSSGEAITADELVRRADAAMYASKDQGECSPVLA
jgi:diguanylate cyclase (GGDEF)-like protein